MPLLHVSFLMQRRQFLVAVGAAGGVGVLAGCLDGTGDLSTGSTDDPNQSNRNGNESGSTDVDRKWLEDVEYEIGNRENVDFPDATLPHSVRVENASADETDVSILISDDEHSRSDSGDDSDEVPFAADFSLEPDDDLTVVLNEPGTFDIRVETADDSATETVDERQFDCNGSSTTFEIESDGIEVSTVSTLLACGGPRIDDYRLEHLESTCYSGDVRWGDDAVEDTESPSKETEDDIPVDEDDRNDDSDQNDDIDNGDRPADVRVTTKDESVIVEGTIQTSTPCYEPTLESVSFDDDDDRLTVVVDAVEDGTDVCIQCVGAVTYRVTVDFERGYPDVVDVKHDSKASNHDLKEYRTL